MKSTTETKTFLLDNCTAYGDWQISGTAVDAMTDNAKRIRMEFDQALVLMDKLLVR